MKRHVFSYIIMCAAVLLLSACTKSHLIGGVAYEFSGDGATVVKADYKGKVEIPDSVKSDGKWYRVVAIGDGAFENCSDLKSVEIPAYVEELGKKAFLNCSSLAEINCRAVSPIDYDLEGQVFDGVDEEHCSLQVPMESVASYSNMPGWSHFMYANMGEVSSQMSGDDHGE